MNEYQVSPLWSQGTLILQSCEKFSSLFFLDAHSLTIFLVSCDTKIIPTVGILTE